MSAGLNFEVNGVKEAMKAVSKFDRDLGNDFKKNARQIMKPIVQDAKGAIPNIALSGMARPWTSKKSGGQIFPWDGQTARKYVKGKTSTKKPSTFGGVTRDQAAFYVSWAGGANAIFDMAGRKNNSVLAANLTGKFGPPSRIMWPAALANRTEVEAQMLKLTDDLMKVYSRLLAQGKA
jgi:hypothetical protein